MFLGRLTVSNNICLRYTIFNIDVGIPYPCMAMYHMCLNSLNLHCGKKACCFLFQTNTTLSLQQPGNPLDIFNFKAQNLLTFLWDSLKSEYKQNVTQAVQGNRIVNLSQTIERAILDVSTTLLKSFYHQWLQNPSVFIPRIEHKQPSLCIHPS